MRSASKSRVPHNCHANLLPKHAAWRWRWGRDSCRETGFPTLNQIRRVTTTAAAATPETTTTTRHNGGALFSQPEKLQQTPATLRIYFFFGRQRAGQDNMWPADDPNESDSADKSAGPRETASQPRRNTDPISLDTKRREGKN